MDIISRIKPFKEEKAFAEKTTKDVIKKLEEIKNIIPVIGGSISKDTWLKGTNEVDIFVKFNYNKFKDRSDEISEILYRDLKKLFKVTRVHGSRDYFHFKYKNFIFEIVPILDIKKPEQALNVTDISPLHINFVRKFPKLKDEIRILKAFCKANLLYGAESYISGFSGYALEVLVIYYRSFENVLKNALKWKPKVIIDFKKVLKNPLKELNPSKIVSPLILIDPVDQTRNIAASLSLDNFNKFIKLSKLYLRNPSEKFFTEKNVIPDDSIKLKILPLKGKKDIIGAKIVKVIDFIKNELKKEGFEILNNGFIWNMNVIFWFKIKNNKLPLYYIHKGPPKNLIENANEFKRKYKKNIFLKNNVYYAKIKRKFSNLEDFLKFILKKEYVKERVREIKLIF